MDCVNCNNVFGVPAMGSSKKYEHKENQMVSLECSHVLHRFCAKKNVTDGLVSCQLCQVKTPFQKLHNVHTTDHPTIAGTYKDYKNVLSTLSPSDCFKLDILMQGAYWQRSESSSPLKVTDDSTCVICCSKTHSLGNCFGDIIIRDSIMRKSPLTGEMKELEVTEVISCGFMDPPGQILMKCIDMFLTQTGNTIQHRLRSKGFASYFIRVTFQTLLENAKACPICGSEYHNSYEIGKETVCGRGLPDIEDFSLLKNYSKALREFWDFMEPIAKKEFLGLQL